MRALVLAGAAAVLFALPTTAQVTQSPLIIGGQGACASTGYNDPGLLDDGMTVASARYTFTLDAGTSMLMLVVENTSPVMMGIPNPVITEIYFNTPSAVTGIMLTGQASSGGAAAAFSMALNQNADGFGVFDVGLSNPQGIHEAIGNPDADTYAHPPVVLSPVTFMFSLTGDLTGVTADDFTSLLSQSSSCKPTIAVAKFQGGGPYEASGYIGDGRCTIQARAVDLGGGCGTARLTSDLPRLDGIVNVCIDSDFPFTSGWAVASPPYPGYFLNGCELFIDPANAIVFRRFTTDENGDVCIGVTNPSYAAAPDHCGLEFNIQAMLFTCSGPLGEVTNGYYLLLGF